MSSLLRKFNKTLVEQQELSSSEASTAMGELMSEKTSPIDISAFLSLLAMRLPTSSELFGFANTMKDLAVKWETSSKVTLLCDTCGTGGDKSNTINISTLSAILLASIGLPIAKHGNRSVSGIFGSADLLSGLGINIEQEPRKAMEIYDKIGITFLYAPLWHSSMRILAPLRKQLGFQTIFNILGPLVNPAPLSHQIIGVYNSSLLSTMAEALLKLGRKGAYVVHSTDGLDELSPFSNTLYSSVRDGAMIHGGEMNSSMFGLDSCPSGALNDLQIENAKDAIDRSTKILKGKGSLLENQTIAMNGAVLYSIAKPELKLGDSFKICINALAEAKPYEILEKWRKL